MLEVAKTSSFNFEASLCRGKSVIEFDEDKRWIKSYPSAASFIKPLLNGDIFLKNIGLVLTRGYANGLMHTIRSVMKY